MTDFALEGIQGETFKLIRLQLRWLKWRYPSNIHLPHKLISTVSRGSNKNNHCYDFCTLHGVIMSQLIITAWYDACIIGNLVWTYNSNKCWLRVQIDPNHKRERLFIPSMVFKSFHHYRFSTMVVMAPEFDSVIDAFAVNEMNFNCFRLHTPHSCSIITWRDHHPHNNLLFHYSRRTILVWLKWWWQEVDIIWHVWFLFTNNFHGEYEMYIHWSW